MNKELLLEYAELKFQEKALKAKLDEFAPKVLAAIQESGADKVESSAGIFSLEKRKTWEFTAKVESQREMVRLMEETEKADGSATYEEKSYLKFTTK